MSEDELAGVLAHELAHIRNHDTLTMTIAATIAGAIGFLAQFAFFFGGMFGGSRNGERANPLVALLVMLLAPLAAALVQMAISRTREFAADRGGAEISGQPLSLAHALQRIESVAAGTDLPSADRNPATAHLFIINPLHGGGVANLFRTHPPTEERIRRLVALAGGREGPSASAPRASRVGRPRATRRASGQCAEHRRSRSLASLTAGACRPCRHPGRPAAHGLKPVPAGRARGQRQKPDEEQRTDDGGAHPPAEHPPIVMPASAGPRASSEIAPVTRPIAAPITAAARRSVADGIRKPGLEEPYDDPMERQGGAEGCRGEPASAWVIIPRGASDRRQAQTEHAFREACKKECAGDGQCKREEIRHAPDAAVNSPPPQ